MKKEDLFDAVGGIRDEYVESAADLLGYTKEDETMSVNFTKVRSFRRAILIAAAIAVLLTTAALAAYFTISHRVPAAEETFPFKWDDSQTGYLEWHDAKLVVTFPEKAESCGVEVRPGWLPFELKDEMAGCQPWSGLTKDTWFTRFSAESLMWQNGKAAAFRPGDIIQPLLIEIYSMSQFTDGGAMLMLYHTPGEITEERWEEMNADAMIFTATEHFDARPEIGLDAYTLTYHHVLLANEKEGWIISVCGQLDMDTILRVAKNLEVRPTGETYTYDDFENHYLFFDGGVG